MVRMYVCMHAGLVCNQVATLERTFNLFDSAQTGELSIKQLVQVLKTLDAVADTEEEVKELLKSVVRPGLCRSNSWSAHR